MALRVNFEYPVNSGVPTAQSEFQTGDTIGLLVKSGNLGMGFTVTIVWDNKSLSEFQYNGELSLLGNAHVQITLPNVVTKGILVFQEKGYFSSPSVSLGLGVGTTAPVTKSTGTINWLLWGGIGLVFAVGGGLLVRKLIRK